MLKGLTIPIHWKYRNDTSGDFWFLLLSGQEWRLLFPTFVKLYAVFHFFPRSPLNLLLPVIHLQKLLCNHTFNRNKASHTKGKSLWDWISESYLASALCQLLQRWIVNMMKRAMTSSKRKAGAGPSASGSASTTPALYRCPSPTAHLVLHKSDSALLKRNISLLPHLFQMT